MAVQGPLTTGSQNRLVLGTYTTTQRNALSSLVTGTLIYNTTNSRIECWDGSTWVGDLAS